MFHYTFFLEDWGKVITGLFAVMLCLQGLSGVWLYRNFWKNFFTLRWRKSARIFLSDTHKMVGISALVFNLILGFTGAWWNLSAVTTLSKKEKEEIQPAKRLYSDKLSLDALAGETGKHQAGFEPAYINLPANEGETFSFYGRLPND